MNSRERFLRCNRFESVDRVPFTEIAVWGQTAQRWLDEGMPADVDTNFNTLKGNEHFGFDRWDYIPLGVGMHPAFVHEVIEEDENEVVFRSGEGSLRRALKTGQVGGTRMSMDQFLDFPVKTRADFEAMSKRYDAADPVRYPGNWADLVAAWRERDFPLALTGIGGFGFYSMLRRWMGTEAACTIFYDDPLLVEDMLEFLTGFFIELTRQALGEVEVDWLNYFEDFAFKTAPLISPDIFRRFLLPRYKRINEHLRANGIDVISLDSDGNIEVLLPLVIEAGFTHICPMEQAAGMDAVAIRKCYGTDLAILGSIDKREIAKDRKAIEQELLRQVPFLLETGGYIPTIDHSIPPDVPYENFLYYIDLKRQLLEGRHGG